MTLDALRRLVPEPEQFVAHWPAEPTLYEQAGKSVAALFPIHEAERLLSSGAIQHPMATLAKDNARMSPQTYTNAGRPIQPGYSRAVWPKKVQSAVDQGATVILESLQRSLPPLGEYCRLLSHELDTPVGVNAYLTPANAQGFAHHYDTHGVLIVQTLGEKTWQLFTPVFEHPLESQPFGPAHEQTDYGEPTLASTLAPGDVLWIPRGWIHNGFSTTDPSVHLSFSLPEMTRHWLLQQAVKVLADNPGIRTRIDCLKDAQSLELRHELESALTEALTWLLEPKNFDAVARLAQREYDSYFLEPSRQVLLGIDGSDLVPAGRPVRVLGHNVRRRRVDDEGNVHLITADDEVVLPRSLAAISDRFADGDRTVDEDTLLGASATLSRTPEYVQALRRLRNAGLLELDPASDLNPTPQRSDV